jgi:hypothetical protein
MALAAIRQPSSPVRVLAIGTGVLLVWALLSVIAYHAWVKDADHRDFFPRWAGARLALFNGAPLYDDATTRQMQLLLYGRVLPPEVDQQGFAYPAQIVIELAPFWWIDDVRVATAVWQGASVLLLVAALLAVRAVHPFPLWLLIPALFWQYTLLMLFQGQFSIMALAALAIGYWLFDRQRDVWAGIVLCLGLVKPELMLLPCMFMCIYALWHRRWRFIVGFIGCGLALLVATVILFGWWIPSWLAQVAAYQQYAQSASAYQTAWALHPLAAAALGVVLLFGIMLLRGALRYGFAASITLGMLLLPQTLLWGLTVLLLPLLLGWQGRARWGVVGVWLLGWTTLFLPHSDTTWQGESLVMTALSLCVVFWGSREGVTAAASRSRRSRLLRP